ncbi:MAG TPA: hypothetical protein VGP46_13050 [Acidimicrobiales bacterium]|nr:hypothetical protein [Acidimicrobiales bacterium]
MLRHEQARIGAELRTIETRQASLDSQLDDWQQVMNLALRFSTRCGAAYRRGTDRTRKRFNAAVLHQVLVGDGHVEKATYKEPFDTRLCVPRF